eukprot:7391605-Prymnesium_polylepis.2
MRPSSPPDTILDPSGEKTTEFTRLLSWALVSSPTSASVVASAHRIRKNTHTCASAKHTSVPQPLPSANPADKHVSSLHRKGSSAHPTALC